MPGRKGGCQKQTKTFQIVQVGEQKMKKAAKTGRKPLCPSYHFGGKSDLALRQGHFAPPKTAKNRYSFARAPTIGYPRPRAQRDLRSGRTLWVPGLSRAAARMAPPQSA